MTLTGHVATDPVAHRARHQRLLDVYGPLLTDHQREACRLHLDEDWSMSELAEHLRCSRSGAHDLVRRALTQLDHYESRLGHAAQLSRCAAIEAELRERLAARAGTSVAGRLGGVSRGSADRLHRAGAGQGSA